MIRIEISFERDEELETVLDHLQDLTLTVSRKQYSSAQGRYRRVYLRGDVATAIRPQETE